MLNIEAISDDLILFLRQRLSAQVDTVQATYGTRIPMSVPKSTSYYIGEWSQFASYDLPACFVVANTSTASPKRQYIDAWNHALNVHFLIEGAGEQDLTRACFRMAEAAYAVMHDQDPTPAGVSTRSVILTVSRVSYGPMLTHKEKRTFRKDIFLELAINHKDLQTPVG